jgi:hypothetical protein
MAGRVYFFWMFLRMMLPISQATLLSKEGRRHASSWARTDSTLGVSAYDVLSRCLLCTIWLTVSDTSVMMAVVEA